MERELILLFCHVAQVWVVVLSCGLWTASEADLWFNACVFDFSPCSGKTTLIKMILGQETPDSGTIKVGETVKLVSVGQERMDQLNSEKTVYEEISEGLDELELGTQTVNSRAYLSWFGFKGT